MALWAVFLAAGAVFAHGAPVEEARALYQRTDYAASLNLLKTAPPSTDAHFLSGQCHFMTRDYKRAIEFFEKTTAADPKRADYFLWLGRAWGRRAESSNPLQAPVFAGRARDAFEKAVKLDPKNLEAVNDLFSYYSEAPGFLGGGLDKAEHLAETVRNLNAAEYEFLQAQLAVKRKHDVDAELHFRKALELEPKSIGRVCDLATFLVRRGRFQEGMSLFEQAARMDPSSPKWRFAQAKALADAKQNFALARQLLDEYVKSPLTPDDPSREEARDLRKKVAR